MRHSLAILIGSLCTAGTLHAAPTTHSAGSNQRELSTTTMEQPDIVDTAKWGFEAPGLFPLDPQQVQSQGGTMRLGPRNTYQTPPHGGLVSAVDRSSLPGRE